MRIYKKMVIIVNVEILSSSLSAFTYRKVEFIASYRVFRAHFFGKISALVTKIIIKIPFLAFIAGKFVTYKFENLL